MDVLGFRKWSSDQERITLTHLLRIVPEQVKRFCLVIFHCMLSKYVTSWTNNKKQLLREIPKVDLLFLISAISCFVYNPGLLMW